MQKVWYYSVQQGTRHDWVASVVLPSAELIVSVLRAIAMGYYGSERVYVWRSDSGGPLSMVAYADAQMKNYWTAG